MLRYEVTFRAPNGYTEVLRVWAESESVAVRDAFDWRSYTGRRGAGNLMPSVVKIGEKPGPSDLNVATSNEEVYHSAFSSSGEELSTIFRPSAAEIRRATRELRSNPGSEWARLRDRLHASGIDVQRSALFAPVPTGSPTPPEMGKIITAAGEAWNFHLNYDPDEGAYEPRTVWLRQVDAAQLERVVDVAVHVLNSE